MGLGRGENSLNTFGNMTHPSGMYIQNYNTSNTFEVSKFKLITLVYVIILTVLSLLDIFKSAAHIV